MKLINCVRAQVALEGLKDKEFDYKGAHGILMLQKKLAAHVAFFAKEEKALMERFGKKDADGKVKLNGNQWELEKVEEGKIYIEKMAELCDVEVDGFDKPLKIKAAPSITPAQLEALMDFVEFETEG